MKRKNFIAAAIMTIPTWAFANKFGFKQKQSTDRAVKKGFVVKADESRYGAKQTKPKDAFFALQDIYYRYQWRFVHPNFHTKSISI